MIRMSTSDESTGGLTAFKVNKVCGWGYWRTTFPNKSDDLGWMMVNDG